MKRYRVTVDGRVYDVEVEDPRAKPVVARLSGDVYRVEVEDTVQPASDLRRSESPQVPGQPPGAMAPNTSAPTAAPGQQVLTAPIPGKIAKLVATAGQTVQRGDALLTIEAMKMFNVIRSPWAGTVTAVHVTEGKHVVQGEPLVSFLVT